MLLANVSRDCLHASALAVYTVLSVVLSAPPLQDKEAISLCTGAQSHNLDVKSESLKKLANLSRDVTFAQEFISRDGLSILSRIVEEEEGL
ncbi:engulfment and cell motility 3 [Pelobates cultripes]|uniref:Engulfment and cell motility 3 n=1 Tax=Pelobates cultripes TaxID=61616 RepID=A0AAD1TBZ4_PELCU|nr:engulfment and cell motility 3 [Pelobates cultripes]